MIKNNLEYLIKYCQNCLFSNEYMMKYLIEERQLSLNTIKIFHLGYFDNINNFIKYLNDNNLNTYEIIKLLERIDFIRRYNGQLTSLYMGRIIFPIWNCYNELIALGGRIVNNNLPNTAKYLNTKFSKSKNLYSLNFAIYNIKQFNNQVLVTEGYLDAIKAFQAGLYTTVAILGVALSQRHIALLSRFFSKIAMIMDGDSAGSKAMERTRKRVVFSSIIKMQYVTLPPEHDLDSYINANGAGKIMEFINK